MIFKLKRLKDILIYIYVNFCHLIEWIYILIFSNSKTDKNLLIKKDIKKNYCNYLIIMQKWTGGVPGSNISDMSIHMSQTFNESNIGSLTEFFIDEFCSNHNKKNVHSELFSIINRNDISHLVFFLDSNIIHSYNLFSINYLTKKFNIKLIPLLPDSVWFFNQLLVRRFDSNASLVITLDSNYFINSNLVNNVEKYVHLFQPLPASQFQMNSNKDIDTLFIGRLEGRSSRKVYIDYLISKGLNVVNIFSGKDHYIEKKEYIIRQEPKLSSILASLEVTMSIFS